jgi:hypothetical protein
LPLPRPSPPGSRSRARLLPFSSTAVTWAPEPPLVRRLDVGMPLKQTSVQRLDLHPYTALVVARARVSESPSPPQAAAISAGTSKAAQVSLKTVFIAPRLRSACVSVHRIFNAYPPFPPVMNKMTASPQSPSGSPPSASGATNSTVPGVAVQVRRCQRIPPAPPKPVRLQRPCRKKRAPDPAPSLHRLPPAARIVPCIWRVAGCACAARNAQDQLLNTVSIQITHGGAPAEAVLAVTSVDDTVSGAGCDIDVSPARRSEGTASPPGRSGLTVRRRSPPSGEPRPCRRRPCPRRQ